MPGVTVTADSPAIQGQKVAITGGEGEYIFRFLPPGDFTVSFALDGVFYPIMGDYVEIDYHPIFSLSGGTNYKTNSVYANDTWRLSPRWTLNLGLRYDKNDGADGAGVVVADDSRISPRLGASWDVNGDGNGSSTPAPPAM